MRLLLHICCAPCAIYPIKAALKDGYTEVDGFFYNPNIQPKKEHDKRAMEAKKYFDNENLKLEFNEYAPDNYFSAIEDFDHVSKRCPTCWEMRLNRAFTYACQRKYDAVTTTLLVSPYQNHDILKRLGEELEDKSGMKFYYRDFRVGFKEAHQQARDKGIYCQNYCGCVFSMIEREQARLGKKKKKNG